MNDILWYIMYVHTSCGETMTDEVSSSQYLLRLILTFLFRSKIRLLFEESISKINRKKFLLCLN